MSTSLPATPRRHWYSIAPEPVLPPISSRRGYTEVLLVYLAFFAVGIVAAALLLANRTQDVKDTGSWGIYLSAVVNVAAEIGLAVAVVLLLAARRGVRPADLGLCVPRRPDGRLAVSQTIRITAWCFFAIILGGIINSALQTGTLPTEHTSAPQLIFAVFDSLQAGVVEELVVLAFVVVTLRQAGRPWWEVTTVALVLRGAYHIYYGPGVVGILVWAALFYWIFLRFRQLVPLMVCHALWDAVAFLSRATTVVAAVGGLLVLVLWVTAVILWLVERGDRKSGLQAGGYHTGGYYTGGYYTGGGHGGGGHPPYPYGYPYPDPRPQSQTPTQTQTQFESPPGEVVSVAGQGPPTDEVASGGPVGGYGPVAGPVAGVAAGAGAGVPAGVGAGGAAGAVGAVAADGVFPAAVSGPPTSIPAVTGPAPGPPPGWHPDPAGHNRWRWWDGYRWTEHVSSHDG